MFNYYEVLLHMGWVNIILTNVKIRGQPGGGGSWYPKYLINMDQNTYYYGQNVTKYLKQSEAVYLIPKISHNI